MRQLRQLRQQLLLFLLLLQLRLQKVLHRGLRLLL